MLIKATPGRRAQNFTARFDTAEPANAAACGF